MIRPFSPTQISTARGCKRKWAFRYLAKIRFPPKDTAALGTELHGIQEAYLRHGTPPSAEGLGALARAGLPHLPAPGAVHVEIPFEVVRHGFKFRGVIDMLGRARVFPGLDAPPDIWCVGDHKTSKDPRKWGIWSKADRLDDEQTLIYDDALDADEVANRWVYYPTAGHAKVKPSDCVLTRREIRGGMERIVLPIAEQLTRLREKAPSPLDVEANTDHCNAFGGCEYRGTHCNPTVDEIATGLFGGEDMSNLWDQLKVNGPSEAPPAQAAAPQAAAPGGFQFSFGGAPAPAPVQTAPAPVQTAPAPVQTAPAQAAPAGQDHLERIGRALIAAGRVLCGE